MWHSFVPLVLWQNRMWKGNIFEPLCIWSLIKLALSLKLNICMKKSSHAFVNCNLLVESPVKASQKMWYELILFLNIKKVFNVLKQALYYIDDCPGPGNSSTGNEDFKTCVLLKGLSGVILKCYKYWLKKKHAMMYKHFVNANSL